ncbi:hypothetical protein [Rhodococcus sp. WWJCD1]|uniref:PIN-like domain-containing protein n=1 Tax=Rhodococcus sp. WWJCD1 TaxID=2022519 RepID=UPI0020CF69E5|nr:hypothetical protein [Rhodococcus sp. WWJCD1]
MTSSPIIPTGTLDVDWITEVGQRDWVLVTNGRRLRTRPDEATAAVAHKLKVVHLHGSAGTANAWGQAERVFQRWAAIEQQINAAPVGPWRLSIESTRHRLLNFQQGSPSGKPTAEFTEDRIILLLNSIDTRMPNSHKAVRETRKCVEFPDPIVARATYGADVRQLPGPSCDSLVTPSCTRIRSFVAKLAPELHECEDATMEKVPARISNPVRRSPIENQRSSPKSTTPAETRHRQRFSDSYRLSSAPVGLTPTLDGFKSFPSGAAISRARTSSHSDLCIVRPPASRVPDRIWPYCGLGADRARTCHPPKPETHLRD